MDFSKLVGLKVLWQGRIPNDNGGWDTYILLGGGYGMCLPDPETSESADPIFLENTSDTFGAIVKQNIDFANNIVALAALLKQAEEVAVTEPAVPTPTPEVKETAPVEVTSEAPK